MSEPIEVPAQLQEQLARLQQLQQTLQAIVVQKQQVELELADNERALTELQKVTDEIIAYKSIGAILVKKDRGSLTKELSEKKELLSVRTSILSKQEEKIRGRLTELQQDLQAKLKTMKLRPED
ncbi:MAG: prefoldin subunit beta [Candidatus Bathyarchaeota archaeon]